jgi:hypothetical protein
MLPREKKYIYDWETKRGKGKWRYILLTTLLWGTLIPLIVLAFRLASKGQLSFDLLQDRVFTEAFFLSWIKYIAGAFVFAWLMWFLSFKKYQELKRKQAIQQEMQVRR